MDIKERKYFFDIESPELFKFVRQECDSLVCHSTENGMADRIEVTPLALQCTAVNSVAMVASHFAYFIYVIINYRHLQGKFIALFIYNYTII